MERTTARAPSLIAAWTAPNPRHMAGWTRLAPPDCGEFQRGRSWGAVLPETPVSLEFGPWHVDDSTGIRLVRTLS